MYLSPLFLTLDAQMKGSDRETRSRLTRLSGHEADMTVSLYVRVNGIYLDVRQTSAPGTDEPQGWARGSRKYLSWTTSDDLNVVLHS